MDKLPVTQADRVAAANYMKVVGDKRWTIEGILSGSCDNTTIVQAFAAHRLAQIAALENPSDKIGEIMHDAYTQHLNTKGNSPWYRDAMKAALTAAAAYLFAENANKSTK